jgi:hypothetical protein
LIFFFFFFSLGAVIVYFETEAAAQPYLSILNEVSEKGKKHGSIAVIYCDDRKSKTLCKYEFKDGLKVLIKHFVFSKPGGDFDLTRRKISTTALINFLRTPEGLVPWEEETTSKDVIHLHTMDEFEKLSRKKNFTFYLILIFNLFNLNVFCVVDRGEKTVSIIFSHTKLW